MTTLIEYALMRLMVGRMDAAPNGLLIEGAFEGGRFTLNESSLDDDCGPPASDRGRRQRHPIIRRFGVLCPRAS